MPAPKVTYTEIDESQLRIARGSVMAIAGPAKKGPMQESTLLRSVGDLLKTYGDEISASHSAIACARQALIAGAQVRFSRSVHMTDVTDFSTRASVAATITIQDRDGTPENTLTVTAKEEGSYANGVTVTIAAASSGVSGEFKMTISSPGFGIPEEEYDNIIIDDVVSLQSSQWIFIDAGSTSVAPDNAPAVGAYTLASGDDGVGSMTSATKLGSSSVSTGIYGFDNVDFLDAFCPDVTTDTEHVAFKNAAEAQRYVSWLDLPASLTVSDAEDFRTKTGSYAGGTVLNSSFAAYNFGDITFIDASSPIGATAVYPNAGAMMGVLARNDTVQTTSPNTPGPWLVPSGDRRGQVRFALGVHNDVSSVSADRDALADQHINWFEMVKGVVTHQGNRTLLLDKTKITKYLHVRRFLLDFEDATTPVLKAAIYEPNNPVLWRSTHRALRTICERYVSNGALDGFYIQCDQGARNAAEATLNTPDVVSAGEFRVHIRLSPTAAAENIKLNVYVDSSGVSYEEA